MGGKQKGQRTKGNVRPSSSGRAAEMLLADNASHGFIGFGGIPTELNFSSANEEFDPSLDGDFRLVMRKMTKKDATTKLKAVQEFSALCFKNEEETLKSVLPFWPRLYNKLSLDHDRRVREATQQAHLQLIQGIKKSLAPYLRSIMACWLMVQCDPYPPAANAAKTAFQNIFPETKQREAILFCKKNIISTIEDNLLHQTADSLSDAKSVTPEEMESKYHRVLSCSLLAWKLFLNSLPHEEHKSLEENYNRILGNSNFWKLVKIDSSLVKGSFFSLLASVCQIVPEISKNYAAKLCPVVFGCIDTSDISISSQVWEAVMNVILTLEDWNKHVNIKKALLPKLWIVLQNGGYGCASTIFPALLPLLSKFHKGDVGDEMRFYETFFNCLKQGLCLDKVRCSVSEYNAIVKTFMECFNFVINQTVDSKEARSLQKLLILDQLLIVIEASLNESNSFLQNGVLYTSLIDVLNFWNKQTDINSTFLFVQDLFWNAFQKLCVQTIDISDEENKILENFLTMVDWFGGLEVTQTFQMKKKGVRFTSDSIHSKGSENTTRGMSKKESTKLLNNKYFSTLLLVLTEKCYTSVENSFSIMHMKLLNKLFWICKDLSLCRKILTISNHEHIGDCDDGLCMMQTIIHPWITKCENENQTHHLKVLIDLIFAVYSHDSSDKKPLILNELCKNKNSILFCFILEKLVELSPSDRIIQSWLKGSTMSQQLVKYVEGFCKENLTSFSHNEEICSNSDFSWRILKCCLSTTDNFEPYISSECMDQIVNTFYQTLPKPGDSFIENRKELEKCITFVCNIAITFFNNCKGCLFLSSAKSLLMTLFEISCQTSLKFQDSVISTVQEAWRTGLQMIVLQTSVHLHDSGFISHAVSHIKRVIFNNNMTIGSLEKLMDLALTLLQDISVYLQTDDSSESHLYCILNDLRFQMVLDLLLPSLNEWTNLREQNSNEASVVFPIEYIYMQVKADHAIDLSAVNNHIVVTCFMSSVFLKFLTDCDVPLKIAFISQHCKQLIEEVIHALAVCELVILTQILKNKSLNDLAWSRQKLYDNLNLLVSLIEDGENILKDFWKKPKNMIVYQFYLSKKQLKDCLSFHLMKFKAFSLDKGKPEEISCADIPITVSSDHCLPAVKKIVNNVIESWTADNEVFDSSDNVISESDINVMNFNLSFVELLGMLVDCFPRSVEPKEWDFLLCHLVSWIQKSCEIGSSAFNDLKSMVLFSNSCSLLYTVSETIDNLENVSVNEEQRQQLISEWKELFSSEIYSTLLPTYLDLYTQLEEDSPISYSFVLQNCAKSLSRIPTSLLKSLQLPSHLNKLLADDDSTMPNNLQTLLNHLCPMLTSSLRFCQLLAFKLLFKLASDLPSFYTSLVKEDDKDPTRSPPLAFKLVLDQCEMELSSSLDCQVQVGVCHLIEPNTNTYIFTSAYLLLWRLLLQFFEKASAEMRAEYSAYLQENNMVSNLLLRLFCLIPENPLIRENKNVSPSNMFIEDPVFNPEGSSSEIQHLACTVYYSTVKYLPKTVRQWWNNLDKSFAAVVDKFTSKYISPLLCNEEIQRVKNTETKIENMVVKARPVAREVVATYNMGDISMDLVIQLPLNYPLGPISLEGGKHVGVVTNQWRNWMLQLMTFLTHQNGSILDGLILWKRNVDKQFEGIEDCMICYSVIHGTNCQLPRLTCRTCKKRFHSACLYKWFNTSNNSTCPLCRNLF